MAETQTTDNKPTMSDEEVVNYIKACKDESKRASFTRRRKSRRNRQAYMGEQDNSHKTAGQSTEFIPKVATAVEQFTAFIKKGLTQSGKWFSAEEQYGPFSPDEIVEILRAHLENLDPRENMAQNISIILSEAVKMGSLESLMIVKVHGRVIDQPSFEMVPGHTEFDAQTGKVKDIPEEIKTGEKRLWRLKVELIASEDYYPDPTGNGLYEIHSVERDYYEVIKSSETGMYDKEKVKGLKGQHTTTKSREETRRPLEKGQNESHSPKFRKKIVIDEFWGDILNEDGELVYENVLATVANTSTLIRKPIANPNWHKKSPFIATPIIRVPFSVWCKALYDESVLLNLASNELFNLMLDGGIGAVWGVRQLRTEWLKNPEEAENGIAQGQTLQVVSDMPTGAKVLEQVTESEVPNDALNMYNLLNTEFNQASHTNDLKLGMMPNKQVKATEVVESQKGNDATLDSMTKDIETDFIARVLEMCWLTILQNADELPIDEIFTSYSVTTAFKFMTLSPKERFIAYANGMGFNVNGLSALLAQVKDFQKLMALIDVAGKSPLLMEPFIQKYDPAKILDQLITTLNIDPESIEYDQVTAMTHDERLQRTVQMMQLINGGGQQATQSGPSAEATGDATLPAQINNQSTTSTGEVE